MHRARASLWIVPLLACAPIDAPSTADEGVLATDPDARCGVETSPSCGPEVPKVLNLEALLDRPIVVFEAEDPRLLEEATPAYARARHRVRVRRFDRALAALEAAESSIFPDRWALVRADALLGLKRSAEARASYAEALVRAESAGVRRAALRGLADTGRSAADPRLELAALEVLIEELEDDAEPELFVRRAEAKLALGRRDAARREIWQLLDTGPEEQIFRAAERLLARGDGARRVSRGDAQRIERARIRMLVSSRRFVAARKRLTALRRKARGEEAFELELLSAELHLARGARASAEQQLRGLLTRRDPAVDRTEILLRLGRLAIDRYDLRAARALFTECAAGRGAAREECAFEAAEVLYVSGDYAGAATELAPVAASSSRLALTERALWLAGWSAHLAGTSTLAIEALETLIGTTADEELKERAAYWLARTLERRAELEPAIEGYHALLVLRPLGFYGLLARSRLELLGSQPASSGLTPPPRPQTPEQVVELLGPSRPRTVDRAIILFREKLTQEAVEELLFAAETYRSSGDVLGLTLIIDLFQLFEREAWAFLAARIFLGEPEALSRVPELWRMWRVAYPTPFEEAVAEASSTHAVDPLLLYAVMRTESRFRTDAVSPVGARGLMQLMPATARWLARTTKGAAPHLRRYRASESNVWLGAAYLSHLLSRYEGNVIKAVGAYNAGPAAMDRWGRVHAELETDELIERVPYDETRRYLRRTLESYLVYRRLYGSSAELELLRLTAKLDDGAQRMSKL